MKEKENWKIAEDNFVSIMEKNKDVLNVEHISLYAQNSEWDVLVQWKDGRKWYVDVTTGVRKKFNKPQIKGDFFLAFTKDNKTFQMFKIISFDEVK